MEFLLLGPLAVRHDDATDLGGPLQRTLLALLLTEVGRAVPTDRIVDELWGEIPPADPAASIQTYVYRLRRALGGPSGAFGALERVGRGYRLSVPPEALDATLFERESAAAHRALQDGDPGLALAAADDALARWRGDVPLEDCGERPFLAAARARWVELRLTCAEDRCAALVALDRHAEAIADLELLTARHPLRERPWVLLVSALHAVGRSADALDRYQRARTAFDEELGLEPGPALRDAQLRVLRGEPSRPVARPPASPAPLPTVGGVPLVGRDAEVSTLVAALDAAVATGTPRFALVVGEPGIGKSRLVAELADRSADRARVVVGHCHEDPDTPALWPWREALSAAGAGVGPSGGVDTGAEGGGGLFALFDDVLRRLVRAAADRPLVVVLDDLHWADATSLRLLAFLAVELRSAPLLAVATSRPDGGSHLTRTSAVLARTPGFARVELGPIDVGSTAALVRAVVDAGRAAPAAPAAPAVAAPADETAPASAEVAALHARAGGNPFFVIELARLLADRPGEATLPAAVRDVVRLRLGELGPDAREALTTAAVAGDAVDPGLVLRAGAAPAAALGDGLDEAVASGLLRATDGGALGFAHAMVREAILADLPDLQRRRVHARLAAAVPPGLSRAQHLLEGRPFTDADEAVEAAEAAAEEVASGLAHEAAARWYARALAVLEGEPTLDPTGGRGAAMALRAGESWASAGHQSRSQAALSEAITLALRGGDLDAAGEAAAVLARTAGFWLWVPYGTYPAELLARLREVLGLLGPEPSRVRARVLGTLASGSHYAADRSAPARLSGEAVAVARAVGDRTLLAESLAQRLFATWGPDDHDAQLADADELVALADDGPLAPWRLVGLVRRAILRVERFDLAGADDDLRSAWDLTERRRLPLLQQQIVQMQAARAAMAGELEVAERLLERAAEIGDRTQLYLDDLTGVLTLTFVRYEQGRLAEVLPVLTATGPDGVALADTNPLLTAFVLVGCDRRAEAAEVFARHDLGAPHPRQWDWLAVECWTAVVVCELGDARAAGVVLERLRPYLGLLAAHGGIGGMAPVTLFAGQCALVAGRAGEARVLLRRAVASSREHGLRPALARSLLSLAAALDGTDAPEARACAAEALDVARAVGMRRVARRAERLVGVALLDGTRGRREPNEAGGQ